MDAPRDLLLIDKPSGITSFDVIRRLRRALGVRKMGHAGTLDPQATGLMLVGVEQGTKQLATLIKLDKTYEAEIVLGERRSTGDLAGEVLEVKAVMDLDEDAVRATVAGMKGTLALPVPAFSAIKKDGQRLYARARKGQSVETPVRAMRVDEALFTGMEMREKRAHVFVTFSVGSGTYIRSLAEELGRRLGYPATLGNLRRTRVGAFRIEDAQALPEWVPGAVGR